MLLTLLKVVAIHQATVALGAWREVSTRYEDAQATAWALNKPLLVAGGPLGSRFTGKVFAFRAHGCGDTCVDIDPTSCTGCEFVPGSITELPFAEKEFGAVFCSHVLEHMPTADACQEAWSELHRVADYVFICLPTKKSIAAWLEPDHHLWVEQVGEGTLKGNNILDSVGDSC